MWVANLFSFAAKTICWWIAERKRGREREWVAVRVLRNKLTVLRRVKLFNVVADTPIAFTCLHKVTNSHERWSISFLFIVESSLRSMLTWYFKILEAKMESTKTREASEESKRSPMNRSRKLGPISQRELEMNSLTWTATIYNNQSETWKLKRFF